MRIGIGYDIHKFVRRRKLILGGVEIPYKKGLKGHSDADVLIHAICDALLGALSERDIGELFPDTDPKYKNISSTELLKKVYGLIKRNDYVVNNLDAVIIAREPQLLPFKKKIRRNLAKILEVREGDIGLKAKTNNGVGEIGRKQAIACYVVVLLDKT